MRQSSGAPKRGRESIHNWDLECDPTPDLFSKRTRFDGRCADVSLARVLVSVDGQTFSTIQQLVADEKYVIGEHASERLQERGIMVW